VGKAWAAGAIPGNMKANGAAGVVAIHPAAVQRLSGIRLFGGCKR